MTSTYDSTPKPSQPLKLWVHTGCTKQPTSRGPSLRGPAFWRPCLTVQVFEIFLLLAARGCFGFLWDLDFLTLALDSLGALSGLKHTPTDLPQHLPEWKIARPLRFHPDPPVPPGSSFPLHRRRHCRAACPCGNSEVVVSFQGLSGLGCWMVLGGAGWCWVVTVLGLKWGPIGPQG